MAHHNAATKGKDKNARPADAVYRLNKAMEMRKAGKSYKQIVEAGVYASRGAACRAVNKELEKVVEDTKASMEVYRQMELDRLDELTHSLWPQAVATIEEPTEDTPEELVASYNSRLNHRNQAADRLLKVIERRCKLLGLEAPQALEHTSPDGSMQPTTVVLTAPDHKD